MAASDRSCSGDGGWGMAAADRSCSGDGEHGMAASEAARVRSGR